MKPEEKILDTKQQLFDRVKDFYSEKFISRSQYHLIHNWIEQNVNDDGTRK